MAEGDPEPPAAAEVKKTIDGVEKTEEKLDKVGKKVEVKEKSEKPQADEKKESKEVPQPPLIILKANLHCEGCARKIRLRLKGLQGVEDVQTDCKAQRVVVKGEKADPEIVLEKLQGKSRLHAELISSIRKPPICKKDEPKEKPKQSEPMKEKTLPPITVLLKVHMHCEACARETQKRIKKMKGVDSVEADLKSAQVTVKGVFDSTKLVQFVYKKTGKQAMIVKQDSPPNDDNKPKEAKGKKAESDEKSTDKKEAAVKEDTAVKEVIAGSDTVKESGATLAKEGGTGDAVPIIPADEKDSVPLLDAKKFEYSFSNYPVPPPLYYSSPWNNYQLPSPDFVEPMPVTYIHPTAFTAVQQLPPPLLQSSEMYAPPTYGLANPQPQMFSDENPNACAVM